VATVAWSGLHDRAREAFAVLAGAAGGRCDRCHGILSARTAYPLMATFATSIVMVMGSPGTGAACALVAGI
jgi:hypothetical protein